MAGTIPWTQVLKQRAAASPWSVTRPDAVGEEEEEEEEAPARQPLRFVSHTYQAGSRSPRRRNPVDGGRDVTLGGHVSGAGAPRRERYAARVLLVFFPPLVFITRDRDRRRRRGLRGGVGPPARHRPAERGASGQPTDGVLQAAARAGSGRRWRPRTKQQWELGDRSRAAPRLRSVWCAASAGRTHARTRRDRRSTLLTAD